MPTRSSRILLSAFQTLRYLVFTRPWWIPFISRVVDLRPRSWSFNLPIICLVVAKFESMRWDWGRIMTLPSQYNWSSHMVLLPSFRLWSEVVRAWPDFSIWRQDERRSSSVSILRIWEAGWVLLLTLGNVVGRRPRRWNSSSHKKPRSIMVCWEKRSWRYRFKANLCMWELWSWGFWLDV